MMQHDLVTFGDTLVRTDPARLIQVLVTGISFLGAGTILKSAQPKPGERVMELTTAASILFVSGIGAVTANWQFILAVGSTVLVLIVLRGMEAMEFKLGSGKTEE